MIDFTDHPGFISHIDITAIESIANMLPNNCTIVELGTMFGKASRVWAEAFKKQNKKVKIYTLDTFNLTPHIVLTKMRHTVSNLKVIRNFVMGEQSHIELTKTLLREYSEIEVISFDFQKDKIPFSEIDCIYDDSFHSDSSFHSTYDRWHTALNVTGVYSGQFYNPNISKGPHLSILEKATTHGLKVINPISNSTVYYLAK